MKYETLIKFIEERKQFFANDIIQYFQENVKDSLGYQSRKGYSLNETLPPERFGDALNQRTIFVTARTFDIWENAIYEAVEKKIKEEGLDSDNKVQRWTDSVGDMKFNRESWEIKSTQNSNSSWTGSTHSSNKTNKYILISFTLDWDFKLRNGNNAGILKDFSMFLVYSTDPETGISWDGKAKDNSSFTTLKIKSEWLQNDSKVKVVKIIGDLKKNLVNCKVIPAKIKNGRFV